MSIAFVYYAKFYRKKDNKSLYKIGVTNNILSRIEALKSEEFEIKLLMAQRFETSEDAYAAESLIKYVAKDKRAKDSCHLPYTETFDEDILNLDYRL